MKNFVSWFEIPVLNFQRAVAFYSAILNIDITEVDMFGIRMGMFPMDGTNISGALVAGDGYIPSDKGPLVYLNGGEDLQDILDRIHQNKGRVIVPKTEISAEMGFFAMFMDTEGNKLALHSNN